MCIRHLGFVLLLWFPAELHGQSEARSCTAPVLDHGLFTPKQDIYPNGAKLTYTCNNGHKPADQGWWATSTCNNGRWSPPPQCIDESSCVQPDVVPNTRISPSPTGWYENGRKIQIRCDKGYETKNNILSVTCINGDWSSMPVCERSADSCSEPPQLPHAVIINQTHPEVFAVDSVVMYQCEDGYTTEQGESSKSVTCVSGSWTEGPTCTQSETGSCAAPVLDRGLFHPKEEIYSKGAKLIYTCNDGQKPAGQGRLATSTCNNGRWSPPPQCINENACIPLNIPNGKYTEAQNGWYEEGTTISITCDTGYEHANKDTTATCVKGTWSSGPICRRSSSSSGFSVSEVQTVAIRNCGRKPIIEHGDYVGNDKMFLQYQCNSFYSLVGPKVVVCYNNRTWSKVPTCKAAFCVLNTENHPVLNDVGVNYIKNGETEAFKCKKLKWYWVTDHYAVVQCIDGEQHVGNCCGWFERNEGICT